jgi:hypothetical protein
MGDRSIAITPHRHPPELEHHDVYGLYNVGWLSFRRDDNGMACLNWWRERCLEWCKDEVDDGKFADQKYLDEWPARFEGVAVLDHPGANLAAWNLAGARVTHERGKTRVDGRPLVFFHFHGLKSIGPFMYDMAFHAYMVRPPATLRRHVLTPYLRKLRRLEKLARAEAPVVAVSPEVRYQNSDSPVRVTPLSSLARLLSSSAGMVSGVLSRKYLLYVARRLL